MGDWLYNFNMIKLRIIYGLIGRFSVCLALLLVAGTAHQEAETEREKSFVVMTTRGLQTNMVEKVAEHLSGSYHGINFEVAEDKVRLSDTPERMAGKIGNMLRENQKGAIVLVNRHWKKDYQVGVFRNDKVVFLNVWSLRLRKMNDKFAMAKYEKRVKKEGVRAIGLLIGLPPTPFPRCAMCPWNTEAELDRKGMNLSPPNHIEARKLLEEMGFELQ